jgi:hypothetical protein
VVLELDLDAGALELDVISLRRSVKWSIGGTGK